MGLLNLALLCVLLPLVASLSFKWSNKSVYNTAATDSTMAIMMQVDEVQVCFADLSVPFIPSGRCNLGAINLSNYTVAFAGNDVFQTVNGTDPFALSFGATHSVIAYTNGNDSQTGTGKALVARATDGFRRLEFFGQTQFDAQPNDQSTMIHLRGNLLVLCYSMGSNDEIGGCRIGEYRADDTVVWSPHWTYYDGDSTDAATLVWLSDTQFLVCYEQGGNSLEKRRGVVTGANGTCQVGTVSGSPGAYHISYSNVFTFNSNGVDEISPFWLNQANGTLGICFNNYDPAGTKGTCTVGYFSANFQSLNFPANLRTDFSSSPVDETNAVLLPPGVGGTGPTVLVCFVDLTTANGGGACTSGQVGNGQQISWSGQKSAFNTVSTDEINLIYLGGQNILLCYVDTPGGSCKFGIMSAN